MNLPIIFITLFSVGVSNGDKIREQLSLVVDLRAVTEFEEMESLYQELHEKNKKTYPWKVAKKKRRGRVKKKLCKKILNSTFFDMQGEEWLHPNDPTNRDIIKNACPHTFIHIFESVFNIFTRTESRLHVNDYRQLPIQLSDNISRTEHLFSCFAADRVSRQLSHYLVSREYNVTENKVDASPMAARFVFGCDENGQLCLIAMAEESAVGNAIADRTSIVELYYVGSRKRIKISDVAQNDPVCGLSTSDKLRLCASIFASKTFRIEQIKFRPLISNVEADCLPRPVTLLADLSKRKRLLLRMRSGSYKHFLDDEWMFACKVSGAATSSGETQPQTYYVARGDRPHTVFLFLDRFSDGKLYVVNYMKNITVVDASSNGVGASSSFGTQPELELDSPDTSDDDDDDDYKDRATFIAGAQPVNSNTRQ